MSENGKVVVNLATGHEDAERVLIAFLVATAAQAQGKQAVMFLTKEAVRLGLPGYADAVEVAGAAGSPPVRAVRRCRGRALRVPDLLRRAQARRRRTGRARQGRRRHTALGVHRRGRDRLQLLREEPR